jgi:Fic family protein
VQAADFANDCPGELVPTDHAALAFVPAPAPRQLALQPQDVRALGAAERALGQLTGTLRASGRHVSPHLVSRPLMRREAIASSRIEGTVTTPEQLVLFEVESGDAAPTGGPASENQEVLNYLRALNHGFARLRELPVCLRLIQEIHGILMEGVRGNEERPGEFRSVQNFIGATRNIHDARYVPPPVAAMKRCLEDLEHFRVSGRAGLAR